MSADIRAILKLEVPVIVQVSAHGMTVAEVLALKPGAIMELPKNADADLEILAHNKQIGLGRAVKVGENFGVRLTHVGPVLERIAAISGVEVTPEVASEDAEDAESPSETESEDAAEEMVAEA